MARRYVISPIIGSGQFPDTFRAAVADVANANTRSVIPTDPQTGAPLYRFTLVAVSAPEFGLVLQVSNLYALPDYHLDGRMDGMEAGARTGFTQSVSAYDLDGQGLHFDPAHDDGDSYRAVLNRLGRQLDPNFDADRFGAAEVSA